MDNQNTTASAHTPGPWAVMHDDQVWMDRQKAKECSLVATCGGFALGVSNKTECRANAHLIAASPDLLAACNAAIDLLSDMDDDASLIVFKQLSDAVEKAGGSPLAA